MSERGRTRGNSKGRILSAAEACKRRAFSLPLDFPRCFFSTMFIVLSQTFVLFFYSESFRGPGNTGLALQG